MAAEIRWSKNAIVDYNNIVDYLLLEWNEDIALRFIEVLEHKIQQILRHPYTGLSTKVLNIRSVSITKHNRLYYRIWDKNLEIVNIFDTRQDPGKDKYR